MLKSDQDNQIKQSQTWRPSASVALLKKRAEILQCIRDFFKVRAVLEVDTPLMCHTSVPDPVIHSIPACFQAHPHAERIAHYLQTSPEYAMKRLLSAGSGAIYQICKAFRQGEIGRYHNPEFMMLEWYRPGFDHHQLMDEMDELLKLVLKTSAAERITYLSLFAKHFDINPHTAEASTLATIASHHQINLADTRGIDRDTWLNLLLTHCIEPTLGQDKPCFIYDFPSSQAALARLTPTTPPYAARFEVYYRGIELANGFHELQDAAEQRKRFTADLIAREQQQLPTLPLDEKLLSALAHGLPDCAGVALGIDRLIMLATEQSSLKDVLSFDFVRA